MLEHLDALIDKPLIVLSFIWIVLLIVELVSGLSDTLQFLVYLIWALFVFDFVLELVIAPDRRAYLRQNWLTVIALALPALRVLAIFRSLRLLRAARTARSLNLVRGLTSVNRGIAAVRNMVGRRGIGFVVLATVLITFAGAALILYFESPGTLQAEGALTADTTGLHSYGDALWWTAMLITTIGSDYWPLTLEGRLLAWLLSLYALSVFGYITATIAAHFVGVDRQEAARSERSNQADLNAVREELVALRAQLTDLAADLNQARVSGSGRSDSAVTDSEKQH